ncbi:hypothetical protein [Pandoraea communis]|uniref:hypothetical protein n=1 Tax=Pandoraea communis TaxID=2508297 RepID=UPI0025A52795|nr:hypothetical protein [Pandoraea communis]MDM8356653.1 hypothetical protein [Pandoraea communis]
MVTEQFKAKDEAGNIYQVVAYRKVLQGGDNPIYGIPEFRLADGRALTPVSERVFRIVQGGTEITLI